MALSVVVLLAAVALIGSVRFHAQSAAIDGRNTAFERAMGQTTWIEEFDVATTDV